MIDISEKGVVRMRELLATQRRRKLFIGETVDLAILTFVWNYREPLGGPIKREWGDVSTITHDILAARPVLKYNDIKPKVESRLSITMFNDGLLEKH